MFQYGQETHRARTPNKNTEHEHRTRETTEKESDMAEPMLGANLDSMADLVGQLDTTTGTIGDVSAEAGSIKEAVVGEMTATFQTAVGRVEQTMEQLRSTVSAMAAKAHDTTWTGANYSNFIDAASQFEGSCNQIAAEVDSAYSEFSAHAAEIGQNLDAFQAVLASNLDSAAASTESMAAAAAAQSEALDATMNQGLHVG